MNFGNKALFRNRRQAGEELGQELKPFRREGESGLVLGLPRGGVPVAYGVATVLELPLDIFLVRKLGLPGHEELALGAIASDGVRTINRDVVKHFDIPEDVIDSVTRQEQGILARRERDYRGSRPNIQVADRSVFLIDDGLATGASMKAAARALRRFDPEKIIVGVPVAAEEACAEVEEEVDYVVCLHAPRPFRGVGLWYEDFSQTTDDEVRRLLEAYPVHDDAHT